MITKQKAVAIIVSSWIIVYQCQILRRSGVQSSGCTRNHININKHYNIKTNIVRVDGILFMMVQ